MSTSESIRQITDEIVYLRAKQEQVAQMTPRLLLIYGNHVTSNGSQPRETVEQCCLLVGLETYPLRLSYSALMIMEILARKKSLLLTARQIERIMAADPLCLNVGANTSPFPKRTAALTRRSIKVYIQRIREQLRKVFRRVGLTMRSDDVLVSEATDLANVVAYRIAIPCEFEHFGCRTA